MNICPNIKLFKKKYDKNINQVLWSSIVSDLETPVSAYMKLCYEEKNSFLLESVQDGDFRGRYSIVGMEPDIIWKYKNGKILISREKKNNKFITLEEEANINPLASLRKIFKESRISLPKNLPPMSAGLVGYMGYDIIRLVENLPEKNINLLNTPDSLFVRPKIMAIFDNIKNIIIFVTPSWPKKDVKAIDSYNDKKKLIESYILKFNKKIINPESFEFRKRKTRKTLKPLPNMSKKKFINMVLKAKKYIVSGDIFQVVLSKKFTISYSLSPFYLYRSLRRLNPSPFLFYFNFFDDDISSFSLIGSSPEILVRLKNKKVTIRPIAGTRPRGKNKLHDNILKEELLCDPKEQAEHLMLLDLGRNDVGKVSKTNTVKVTEKMIVELYSHVMHIVSNVEGDIKPQTDLLDALMSGFPAGTVSGAPKIRAMEIIDELENEGRGIYAGCVGYFSANGDMETCIVLRTAIINKKKMYVQAGAGIVADSNPDKEYEEIKNKAKALFHAAEVSLNLKNISN